MAKVLIQNSKPNSVIDLDASTLGSTNGLAKRILNKFRLTLKLSSPRKIYEYKNESGSIWCTQKQSNMAIRALKLLETDPSSVLVLPAAEDQFCNVFACAHNRLKKRIFACFHQPPSWFRLNWRNFEDFESLGGIICLSDNQASYFHSISQSPVCVIRHGVRYNFFSMPQDPFSRQGNRVIFVGQWLRDFDTLAEAMELIWKRRPDIYLDCVVPYFARNSEPIQRLAVDPRVKWYANLPDSQLRMLYQAADLLFIPVIDAVANNAVIEALASGLPVVTTNVGGMNEYIPSQAGSLCPRGDVDAHADAVIKWLSNPRGIKIAAKIARKHSIDHFDWQKIGARVCEFIAAQSTGVLELDDLSAQERVEK